jgi:hypothetical protein
VQGATGGDNGVQSQASGVRSQVRGIDGRAATAKGGTRAMAAQGRRRQRWLKVRKGLPFTPSGHLIRSFNWYQSQLGHTLSLTGFVTRRRHGERCCKARGFQWWEFWLLKKPKSQLPLESGLCHLGDCSRSLCDPSNT